MLCTASLLCVCCGGLPLGLCSWGLRCLLLGFCCGCLAVLWWGSVMFVACCCSVGGWLVFSCLLCCYALFSCVLLVVVRASVWFLQVVESVECFALSPCRVAFFACCCAVVLFAFLLCSCWLLGFCCSVCASSGVVLKSGQKRGDLVDLPIRGLLNCTIALT